jgi:hypothetical protein
MRKDIEINTVEDLFSYLGPDYYPDDYERSKSSLSRAIYKGTNCGAWADFSAAGNRRNGFKHETWSCTYQKKGDDWSVVQFVHPNGKTFAFKDMDVPAEVFDYFFPDIDSVSSYLSEQHPGENRVTVTEEVRINLFKEHQGVFIIGSIVEGVDAEVPAREVYLPCKGEDIDMAIADVESEAEYIWQQTHGCDACALEGEWGGRAINQDCKECNGEGTII